MMTTTKMTKTDGKYTYEDLMLRRQNLKHDIRELEKIIMLENVPKTLAFAVNNLKEKSSSGNILKFALETGAGFLVNRLVLRRLTKVPMAGKVVSFAASYAVPFLINKAGEVLFSRKEQDNDEKKLLPED